MTMTVVFDMHQTIYCRKDLSSGEVKQGKKAITAMPKAIETFLDFYEQGYKIVIISSSVIQASRQRLEYLFQEHGLSANKIKEIFADIDILTSQYYGSKHDSDCWQQVMQPYQNIEYIFEDGENKLQAAGEAARALDSDPELYTSISEFSQDL